VEGNARGRFDWLIVVVINVGIGATLYVQVRFSDTTVSNAIISAIIVFPLLNGSFLWSIVRRDRRIPPQTTRGFLFGASALALVAATGTLAALAAMPERSYARLAVSNVPLGRIYPERRRIFVEFLRNRIENAKRQSAEAQTIKQHPLSSPLYSPATFASPQSVDEVLHVIRESSREDLDYYERNKTDWSDFCTRMAPVDEAFLESMQRSLAQENSIADRAADIERQWYSHTVALYTLARNHTKEIQINGGAVRFPVGIVGEELDNELRVSRSLYDRLMEIEAEQARKQQSGIQREGAQ